jgi:hypothetical protein
MARDVDDDALMKLRVALDAFDKLSLIDADDALYDKLKAVMVYGNRAPGLGNRRLSVVAESLCNKIHSGWAHRPHCGTQ